MSLVYLDTETTGLDPERHEIWELAYAIDDGPVYTAVVDHSLRNADPVALGLNGYDDRAKGVEPYRTVEVACRGALEGNTLVGANPAFDAAFLRARWGVTPWRYRLLDIEAYAMGALGFDEPKGLAAIAEALECKAPDHSAKGDVYVLRACHKRLQAIYAGVRW